MDASTIINLGIFILTGLSLVVTLILAMDARKSKVASAKSAEIAAAARLAADAAIVDLSNSAARGATASEGIDVSAAGAAQSLERLAARPAPWRLDKLHPRNSDWKLTNSSASTVLMHSLAASTPEDAAYLETRDFDPRNKLWSPGEMELIAHSGGGGLTAPAHITIRIEYNFSDEGEDAVRRRWSGLID